MRGLLSGMVPVGLGMIFSFLGTALLARMVGPAIFGEYSYILTWVLVAAMLSKAGHEWLLLKLIPGRLKADAHGQIRCLLRQVFFAVIVRAAAASALLFCMAMLSPYANNENLVVVGLLLVFVLALAELRRSWALAHRAVWLSDAPENIGKSIILTACVAIFFVVGLDVTVEVLLVLNLCATVVTAIVATVAFLRIVAPQILSAPYEPLPASIADTGGIVRAMWFSTAINISMRNLDLIVVGVFGTGTETGLYAAASRLGQLAAAPTMIFDRLVTPLLAEAAEDNDKSQISVACRKFVLLAGSGAAAIFLLFLTSGELFIRLFFGTEYAASLKVALIILCGNTALALAGPSNVLMAVSGSHRESASITAAAGIFNLVLLLVLVPIYGVIGAALATATAISTKSWLSAMLVKSRMAIDTTAFAFFKR